MNELLLGNPSLSTSNLKNIEKNSIIHPSFCVSLRGILTKDLTIIPVKLFINFISHQNIELPRYRNNQVININSNTNILYEGNVIHYNQDYDDIHAQGSIDNLQIPFDILPIQYTKKCNLETLGVTYALFCPYIIKYCLEYVKFIHNALLETKSNIKLCKIITNQIIKLTIDMLYKEDKTVQVDINTLKILKTQQRHFGLTNPLLSNTFHHIYDTANQMYTDILKEEEEKQLNIEQEAKEQHIPPELLLNTTIKSSKTNKKLISESDNQTQCNQKENLPTATSTKKNGFKDGFIDKIPSEKPLYSNKNIKNIPSSTDQLWWMPQSLKSKVKTIDLTSSNDSNNNLANVNCYNNGLSNTSTETIENTIVNPTEWSYIHTTDTSILQLKIKHNDIAIVSISVPIGYTQISNLHIQTDSSFIYVNDSILRVKIPVKDLIFLKIKHATIDDNNLQVKYYRNQHILKLYVHI